MPPLVTPPVTPTVTVPPRVPTFLPIIPAPPPVTDDALTETATPRPSALIPVAVALLAVTVLTKTVTSPVPVDDASIAVPLPARDAVPVNVTDTFPPPEDVARITPYA